MIDADPVDLIMTLRSIGIVIIGISLVAAACSSAGEDGAVSTVSTNSTAEIPLTTTQGAGPTALAPTIAAPPSPAVALPDAWTVSEIARGVKPDLAFAAQNEPTVAYLLENREGFIAFAAEATGWAEERIAEGYFYGPIGLAYDLEGSPIVAYHDHQDVEFNMDLGDLVVATRSNTGWTNSPATDDGHDGWDGIVAVAQNGAIHAVGIDPQQFEREDGIEHYVLTGNRWSVTPIGSGPIEYEWNVSLAIKPDGEPALTYFDNNTQDLKYAERVDNVWSIETVIDAGDVGRFSSLAVDIEGSPHISFYEKTGETSGTIRNATRVGGTWVTEHVGVLDDVVLAFTGARRMTSLDLHPNGAPLIAFSDLSGVYLATRGPSGWETSTLVTADVFTPGQMVDLGTDDAGTPHLVTYAVTNESPLDGIIIYLTAAG